MPVADGYQHDIFLSYAHVDDAAVPGSRNETGWVSTFYDVLNYEVRQRLGRADAHTPWKDDDLRYDQSLTRQLLETVRNSAILLVMLSPGYVRSDWCRRERTALLEGVRARGDAPVLVVEKEPVDGSVLPEEFRDRKRFPFWTGTPDVPRTLGHPRPNPDNPNHAPFYDKIADLSREIAKVLTELAPPPARSGLCDLPVKPIGKTVFLAQVTDDLEADRDSVRAFLDQRGIRALPPSGVYYPQEPKAFREAAEKDLQEADVFVQLLSGARGIRPPDLAQGYAKFQWELASSRPGKSIPILQWCSPLLDICKVTDPDLRALMQSATVRAESLVDFQRAILAAIETPTAPSPTPTTNILVFVNVDSTDRELAEKVKDILGRCGAEVSLPALGEDSASNREDLANNLRSCDGLIVVYGQTTHLWVRRQLLEFRKQRAFRAPDHPILALNIFEGPPPGEKLPIGMTLKDLVVQDCRDPNVLEAAVRSFLDRVQARMRPKAA